MRRVVTWLLALVGVLALAGATAVGWALWVWFTTMPWAFE